MIRTALVTMLFLAGMTAIATAQSGHAFAGVGCSTAINVTWVRTTADFDGDGDHDLVIHTFNTLSAGLGIIRNDYPLPPVQLPHVPAANLMTSVAAGDLDGDGDDDLVSIHVTNPPLISTFISQGAGTNFVRTDITIPQNEDQVYMGDMDGDGDLDVIVGRSTVLHNDGAGTLGAPVTLLSGSIISGPVSHQVADFDGDGDADILENHYGNDPVTNASVQTMKLWLNNAGTLTSVFSWNVPVNAEVVAAAGDFDGDGDIDIAEAEVESHLYPRTARAVVRTWLQTSPMNWVLQPEVETMFTFTLDFLKREHVRVSDLNGDGVDDFAIHLPNGPSSQSSKLMVLMSE